MFADDDNQTLPSPGTKRWTPARKAAIIEGVRGGLLTIKEACGRFRLSIDDMELGSATLTPAGSPD